MNFILCEFWKYFKQKCSKKTIDASLDAGSDMLHNCSTLNISVY